MLPEQLSLLFVNRVKQRTTNNGNRSQVQGSTFRVKDKEGIKDPKSSLKMLMSSNNCQFGSKFCFSLTKLTIFSLIRIPNAVQGRGCNLEPLNL